MPPKKKQKRKKPSVLTFSNIMNAIGLGSLAIPAGINLAEEKPMQAKVLRLRRDYTGVDENGKFRGEFLVSTYSGVVVSQLIKVGINKVLKSRMKVNT